MARQLGTLDFAGGTVVHINAGVSALAATFLIGKRVGYGEDTMLPHNIPFVVLGTVLLWFGWFGFNAGSALASGALATNAFVVTNTVAAAAFTWLLIDVIYRRAPSIIGAGTGAVAGLVAITPASGFVSPLASVAIGIGAGLFCYLAVLFRARRGFDDAGRGRQMGYLLTFRGKEYQVDLLPKMKIELVIDGLIWRKR